MQENTNTKIEYNEKTGELVTTQEYPKRDMVLQVGGVSYTVGFDGPNSIKQTVTKDNIPLLLEYLKEQFGLINGRYEESKKQLKDLEGLDDKVVTALENHAQNLRVASGKDWPKMMRKFTPYAELADKALKKIQLQKAIADTEPNVKILKEQIETVLKVVDKLNK